MTGFRNNLKQLFSVLNLIACSRKSSLGFCQPWNMYLVLGLVSGIWWENGLKHSHVLSVEIQGCDVGLTK